MFLTNRQNFCRISHLGTFPPKRSNFRRISNTELFPTKRQNFRRISHPWTFPPKRPNFRRFSHSGCFRRNGRMNPDEFTPTFIVGNVSDETAEFRSQGRFRRNRRINPAEFRTGDDSDETAEFPPNFALGDVSPEWPKKKILFI
ncbi:MAG: hypothetical protein Q8881_04290 [Sweet potato little leaf phytoplasma]|nr:hypothetical protein [Sweet potato little leaf phytoplasma]